MATWWSTWWERPRTASINRRLIGSVPGGSFGVSIGVVDPSLPQSYGPSSAASSASSATRPIDRRTPASAEELSRNLHPSEPYVANEAALLKEILNLNHIDDRSLDALEREGNPGKSAAAYVVAAEFELKHNEIDRSRRYARRALDFSPDNVSLLCWYAAMALQAGQMVTHSLAHNEPWNGSSFGGGLCKSCGFAYYQSNRTGDAVHTWKRSLQLQPDEHEAISEGAPRRRRGRELQRAGVLTFHSAILQGRKTDLG